MSLVTNDDHQAIKCGLSGMSTEMYCYPLIIHGTQLLLHNLQLQASILIWYKQMFKSRTVRMIYTKTRWWRLFTTTTKTLTELASHLLWFGFVTHSPARLLSELTPFPKAPHTRSNLLGWNRPCVHKNISQQAPQDALCEILPGQSHVLFSIAEPAVFPANQKQVKTLATGF